jgi:hypothetical protein
MPMTHVNVVVPDDSAGTEMLLMPGCMFTDTPTDGIRNAEEQE